MLRGKRHIQSIFSKERRGDKLSNIPAPEYDKPGFCCLCHTQIAEFDGETIVKIKSNITSVYLRLNDESMMQVTLCQPCKDSMTEQDVPTILDSVYKGWVVEADKMVVAGKWSSEKRKDYLDTYGAKYIKEVPEKGFSQQRLIDSLGESIAMNGAVKAQEIIQANLAQASETPLGNNS